MPPPPDDEPVPESSPPDPAPAERAALPEPPDAVLELAEACRRFVRGALQMELDFTPKTLPLLDHYLATNRVDIAQKPEMLALVTRAVGAYFGEVFRRRHAAWWRAASDDPWDWEVQAREVYLVLQPVGVAYEVLVRGEADASAAGIVVEDDDREALAARLAELPVASDDELYALSTRLKVLDIAVDVIKARMMANGLGNVAFGPDDYDL